MNSISPAQLVEQISRIQHMERGKLSIMREGPDGPYPLSGIVPKGAGRCRSREEAEQVLKWLAEWTAEAGLILHPTKTRLVEANGEGSDFLGWHFQGGKKWPRKKSLEKLRDKLRPLSARKNGLCLGAIVARVNPILKGWRNYFHESHPTGLSGPDGWLRRRLWAMLRKRDKRPGFGKSEADHKRWSNRWFAARGLYSLEHGSCAYG